MSWQENRFQTFKLYAVTDLKKSDAFFLKKVELAYRSGVDILQLRSKTLSMAEKIRLGLTIRKIATRLKKLYFVNDSLELALLTNADGLHVGQDDLPPQAVRVLCRKLKRRLFLGLSTHSLSQAQAALTEPIDYFAVGPVFATPTKPHYGSVGLELLKKVSRFAAKPWVAIGGIDESNLEQVLDCGASRAAVVRAAWESKNIGKACNRLSKILKGER